MSAADDPALKTFGDAVAGLLRTGEVPAFVAATGPAGLGVKGKDLEKYEMQLGDSARGLLAMPERIKVDFARAPVTVQQVIANRVGGAAFGTVDGLGARPLQVVLNVGGEARGAGRYMLEFDQAVRRNGQWLLASGKMRWQELPEGLLAGEDQATMALENYVAEHRSLPQGHVAPEIELARMTDDSRVALSSYRGKFVILEFWATWCGPCQEPMAKLQQLYQEHPEWKDRVEMITVSIDSKAARAAEHLQARGWNKTTNFWAGEGEFKSPPALAYRVSGIPTSYVIGPDGKIVGAGHPGSMDFVTLIETAARR
jgi:thiol-disulfide isomerase/thioredoxin